MKAFYLTIAAFGFAIAVHAQTKDTIVIIHPREQVGKTAFSIPKPRLLAKNKNEKIVSLPLDNMLCFMPDLKNQVFIPTKKLIPESFIPNKTP